MSAFLERVRAALATKGYEVLRQLGSGGMGVVVLARHIKLNRLVAVKVIRPEMHTAVAVERFSEEARTLASLSHPHIVPVYETDEAAGFPYYTMQYLDGETVADRLRKGPLLPEEVRKLGRDLLDALECAHTHNVVHRDVKPSNVFFINKRAVLVDFGIAKRLPAPGDEPGSPKEPLTAPGMRPGTRQYMAPEQLAGAEATPASDLYAAALVLYEAYTARHWPEMQHLGRRAWAGFERRDAQVLKRGLAWGAGDRWPDAASFRRAIWHAREWRYQRRTIWLSVAGLFLGAATAAFAVRAWITETWPFHRASAVRVIVAPFDAACAGGEHGADRVAHRLVRDLRGYADFSVSGPVQSPWLLTRSTVIVRGAICARGDSLDAEVAVEVGAASARSRVTARGDTGHVDELSDTLAHGIVLEIWNRQNPLDPVLPIEALPRTAAGLAAWLVAERLLAEARWGDADSAYAAAEAIDSTCWLCYWRHREVQQWLGRDPDAALTEHYLAHLSSFPPRYRSLMRAVSLPLRERLDTLRQTTRKWRDFFPAWFQLADELYHRGPLVGYARADAVEAFQMTARLRPTFGPALEHLSWALTAEGDSTGASAAWSRLEALGDPTDPFTVAIRALLRVGYACRFHDSAAARGVIEGALGSPRIQGFPQLAAGPRYLATFDAPTCAVEMGALFAATHDRGLQRSGLIAGALGHVSLGQVAPARAELAQLRDRFGEREWDLMNAELGGALLLVGLDAGSAPADWRQVAGALEAQMESPSAPAPTRQRAAWLLMLASRRFGRADTARYRGALAEEPPPRPLGRLLAADVLAHRARYGEALKASEALTELDASALSGARPVDPFFRTVLHLLRSEWAVGAHHPGDAERELLWYQNNDASGFPTGDPQVGDVDWGFGTLARWRRAALLEQDRPDEACRAYGDVARLWAAGEPLYRARADSAARRLLALGCRGGA